MRAISATSQTRKISRSVFSLSLIPAAGLVQIVATHPSMMTFDSYPADIDEKARLEHELVEGSG